MILKDFIKQNYNSQREFASHLGVSDSTVSKHLRGTHNPKIKEFCRENNIEVPTEFIEIPKMLFEALIQSTKNLKKDKNHNYYYKNKFEELKVYVQKTKRLLEKMEEIINE